MGIIVDMNCKEIVGKDQFAKARDEGSLLTLSNIHNQKRYVISNNNTILYSMNI